MKISIHYLMLFVLCGLYSCKNQENQEKQAQETEVTKPNIVIIFTDDQGYGDLGIFDSPNIKTPNIDKMAAEGVKLTDFYVAAPLCTPSRAALLTGSHPVRVNMATGSRFMPVILSADSKGLNPDEITIPEILKTVGYTTGIFGKWHLGDQPEFLPTKQGFDEFFGIPYSHDIHPFLPWKGLGDFPPLPLLKNEEVIELEPDADYLTQRITEASIDFIEHHKEEPFFLYIPHPIPHRPLHVSPKFMENVSDARKAKLALEDGFIDYETRDSIYNIAVEEIDWSVGEILKSLKDNGLDENTLVIFTSDNGPAKQGIGSAGPLRGFKASTYEGGMRVPTVMRWPNQIEAGQVNHELITAMDLLPTIANLTGGEIPQDRTLDGKDVWQVLTQGASSPHEYFYYYLFRDLKAVRSGEWKLHLKKDKPTELYNLDTDISESNNVIAEHPEIVKRLLKAALDYKKNIDEDNRPAGHVEHPKALTLKQ